MSEMQRDLTSATLVIQTIVGNAAEITAMTRKLAKTGKWMAGVHLNADADSNKLTG